MPERIIRTLGATTILVVLGVGAFIQISSADTQDTAAEIVAQAVDSSTSITATSVAGEVETTTTTVAEPMVYKLGILSSISTENFWAYYGGSPTVWDAYVLAPTKASLYRIDPGTLEMEPELAAEMESPVWNGEGWKVEVRLRGDLAWSDGTPFTARDIAFTFDVVRSLELGGQWESSFPAEISAVTALDDYHVVFEFDGRPSLEVWPYAAGTVPIMASHVWGEHTEQASSAADLYEVDGVVDVSSGPLEIVQIDSDRIVSRANPGYKGDVAEIVEYRVFETEEAAISALGAGEVHSVLSPKGLNSTQAAALEAAEGIRTVMNPQFGIRFLAFNLERDPMSSIEFRQAVATVVDRDALADEVASAPVADTVIPSLGTKWHVEEAAAEIAAIRRSDPGQSLAEAVAGLEAIGYSWTTKPTFVDGDFVPGTGLLIDGRPMVPLTILTAGDAYDPARNEYANEIASAIEILGFKVIPVSTDFDSVIDLTFNEDESGQVRYDMAILGWSLGNPGLPSFYRELFGSGGAGNNTGYASETMDRLVAAYHQAHDFDDARAILWQMEKQIALDMPYLPLYSSQITEAYRSDQVSFVSESILGGFQSALGGVQLVSPPDS